MNTIAVDQNVPQDVTVVIYWGPNIDASEDWNAKPLRFIPPFDLSANWLIDRWQPFVKPLI